MRDLIRERRGMGSGAGGGVLETRYSLREFQDGQSFVDVETDQDLFDGLDRKEREAEAKSVIRDRFVGRVIGQTKRAFVNGDTAGEYAHPSMPITDALTHEAKMRASTELDNLMEAGFSHRTADDGRDGHVHKGVSGYEYYDIIFRVGDEYYQGVVNVENNRRGSRLKDVTKIRNVTEAIHSSYGQMPLTAFLSNTSMFSISESDENSNIEISGLRSRFDDLTAADRAATERENIRYSAEEQTPVRSEESRARTGRIGPSLTPSGFPSAYFRQGPHSLVREGSLCCFGFPTSVIRRS